ncbi:MAG: GNAT family N-acetyltransferase [Deferrisomatales bacterium]|nr:GNAT family N-acetyltransferase [Deferrisomatales bacterium]
MSAQELERLFPPPSSTAPLLSLLQESGVPGFHLRSIVVFQGDAPILLLPLFECRLDVSTLAGGWLRRSLRGAVRLFPSVFHPRVLGVGLLEGGWSEIGIARPLDATTLAAAWRLALDSLQMLATERKSDLVTFYNFNHTVELSGEGLRGFHRLPWVPGGKLPIPFDSMEDYFGLLSSAARKDLRRKMRASSEVTVTRNRDISPYLDRIYGLYLATVERVPMAAGLLNRLFFEKICERVPGAEYALYFVQEELAAFNLLVAREEMLVDKYFCMDYAAGRQHNLYFLSWLENIRYCVEHKIPLYHAGQGAQNTKAHLGAKPVPSFLLLKHRRPGLDRFLFEQPAVVEKMFRTLGLGPPVSPDAASK